MHLVLGADGALGGAFVRALRSRGEPVRALLPADRRAPADVEAVRGDPAHLPTLIDTAKDCASLALTPDLPTGAWDPDLLHLTEQVVEATRLTGVPVLFPSTLHGLKPIYAVPLPPDGPRLDVNDRPNPLGHVRNLAEDHLQQNAELCNVRTIVVRHGDLYGPGVSDPIVAPMLRAARAGQPLPWPGARGTAHAFTFVDDVAEVAVRLLQTPGRPTWEVAGVAGDSFLSGDEWAAALSRAAGRPVSLRSVPAWLTRLRALWNADARAVAAVLYQWEGPLLLDDTRTRRILADWQPTPLDEALARTFAELL